MNGKSFATRLFITAGSLFSFALAACSGGGSGGTSIPKPATEGTTALISIIWPSGKAASVRHRDYLSDGTASITITVNGATTEVDNPNLSPGGTTAPTQTSSSISVPVAPSSGTTSFTVKAYDKVAAAGNLLGSGTAAQTIVADQVNPVNITLNGNLASITCLPVAPYDTTTSTANTFMQVGISGALQLIPKDAAGYTIVAPGILPALTLTAVDATMAKAAPGASTNQFYTNVTPTATAEKFTASGTDLVGTAHTTTCTITRDAALYVTNVGKLNVSGQQSITVYDATVLAAATLTSAQAPVATISAPGNQSGTSTDKTAIAEPQYLAVDSNGYLFVANQGPMPGATYGPTSGYIAIYAPGAGQSGNTPPVAYIPGLNRPEGVAFDAAGTLYVLTVDRILEYPKTADGETASATATKTIIGSNTDLSSCYGLAVDSTGQIYTACSDVINIFAAGASGNATPTLVELPTMTSMTFDSVSWLGIAVDSSANFYAPAANNNAAATGVYDFQAGSTMGAQGVQVKGTGFSQPMGIAVDASDAIYVTNYGNSSVEYFSSATTLLTGVATVTLSGAATNLNYPFGVTVR